MISNEIYNSDVIYIGGRIISVDDFQQEFPDWYEMWDSYQNENGDKYILCSDYEYGISATLNAFYKINFDKAEANLLCTLEGGEYGGIYGAPIRIGDRMIFTPCRSKKWAYFDLITERWTYVDIPGKFYHQSNDVLFHAWKPIRDSLIFLPGEQGIFVKLDCKSGEITYHDCLKKLTSGRKSGLSFSAMSTYRSSVLISSAVSDEVFEIDAENMDVVRVHKIGHNIRGIKSMYAIPKTDWVFFIENTDKSDSGDMRAVYKWNISTNDLLKIDSLPIHPCGGNGANLLSGFLYYKGELYITPQQGDCFIRVNIENNLVERIEIDTGHNLLERKNSFYKRWGDNMAFPLFNYNGFANMYTVTLPYDFSLAEIDFENKRLINQRKWQVNGIEGLLKKSLIARLDSGGCYENEYYSLRNFIGDIL